MMIKYMILGIIQGLTEFLPVSSSGHLVIMQKVLGVQGQELALSVVLHLATCLALIIFFFKDILGLFKDIRMLVYVAVVTAITGAIGLSGKDFFERLFLSPSYVGAALMVTGLILILTKKFMQGRKIVLTTKDAVILGITQGIAIIPGISRSGITISTLLFRNVSRETSFRLSFLVSIPAVLGATLLEAKDISGIVSSESGNFAAGFIFSFLSGLVSLWLLKLVLRRAKLHYFGYYCILIAVITLLFLK